MYYVPVIELYAGRKKYDKSKNCVRCKDTQGNIVIRHAVYCKFVALECITALQKLMRCEQELLHPSAHSQVPPVA